MLNQLYKLSELIQELDSESAEEIISLAGRYDKAPIPMPIKLQPAFKYIMYLKLMRGLDDRTFHYMKRKYIGTSTNIQEECRRELDKIISQDALKTKYSSAEIRRTFEQKLRTQTLI